MRMYACEAATTEAAVVTGCPCAFDTLPVSVPDLIDAASDALFILSGGLASGRCTTTVRPCSTGGCTCGDWSCACCMIDGITLPGWAPQVTEVRIDGVVVDPADYAIANGNILARRDGRSWPLWQNPLLPDTANGTFSVTYRYGMPYDFMAQMAAVELVCEMAQTLAGGRGRLPKGTVSATADGVQIVIGRLPGVEDISAVGLTWLGRFLAFYGNVANPEVRSPELDGNWVLNRVVLT
jgi:hypothetical protein